MKSILTGLIIFLITQSCVIEPRKKTDRSTASATVNFETLNKNIDFYYLTQNMVRQFDSELERIYQIKKSKKILSPEDFEILFKQQTELRLAWEFSEKNLDELLNQYSSVVEAANNNESPDQLSAQSALLQLTKQLSTTWNNGDKLPLISISQHLSDINLNYQSISENFKTVDFNVYASATNSIRKKEYTEISKKIPRKIIALNASPILNEWIQYKNERLKELSVDNSFREPQALDILEPSADGKGTVTGNRFPTGTWALTYDDGPHPVHTRQMYNVLKLNSTQATFFWLTKNILLYPDIAKESLALGHSRASHSYNHPQLPKINSAQLEHEVTEAGTDFAKIIGSRPTLFRCPYGDCGGNNSTVRQLIAKNKMIHVGWNVDTLDWQDKNPISIFERTKKQMDILGRGIILFHDIHTQSVEATKLLIPYMKNVKKYQIKPLKEIISIVREKPFESP